MMPKVKKGKRYRKSYNEDLMQRALIEIRHSGSIRTVSSKYGIPRSTLQYRLSTNFKKAACGPSPVLTLDEEKNIKQWIITCEKRGFPVDKETVRGTVKRLLDKNNRNTIFKNNCPGNGWYRAFLRRHPELFPPSTSEGTRRSSRITPGKNWTYWHIYEYLKSVSCEDILNDPQRIYKTDETNFQICPKTGEIIFHEYDGTDPKTTISVMHMFSAAGKCTPPVLVFPCRKMLMDMRKALPNKWGAGLSGLGYVNSNILYDYISCILRPNLIADKVKLPVVLFVDDRTAYFSFELFDICNKLKIILISLSPNATTSQNRVLRTHSGGCTFKPLKSGWSKALTQRKLKQPNSAITKEHLLPMLQNIVGSITPNAIRNGMKMDGIYPWTSTVNEKKSTSVAVNSQQRPQKSPVQLVISKPPPVLEFAKFKILLGPERLKKLQSGHVVNENSDFRILQKIYNHFACIDVLLDVPKEANSSNRKGDFVNDGNSDEGHIIAEHISLPELIKAEPLDFEFENEYSEINPRGEMHEVFYQDVIDDDISDTVEVRIKTEYSDCE